MAFNSCWIVDSVYPGEIMTVRLNITMDDALYAGLTPDRAALDAAYRAARKERWRRRRADDWRRTETEARPE